MMHLKPHQLILLFASLTLLSGCASWPEAETISAPGTDMKYSFMVEIPVVRPSTWERKELNAEGLKLADNYKKTNLIAYRDLNEATRLAESEPVPGSVIAATWSWSGLPWISPRARPPTSPSWWKKAPLVVR